jgi:arginine exporter protein ArgO
MSNPIPILIFTAIFAALGIHGWEVDFSSTATLVMGVFAGSALWSPILVSGANLFQIRQNKPNISFLNKISGFILCGFGVVLGARALLQHLH